MKYCSILLMLLVMVACEKKGQDTPIILPKDPPVDTPKKSPFLFVPRSDVKWIVHYQGTMIYKPGGYQWDTSYHFYLVITPTGLDSIQNGISYSEYNVQVDQYNHGGLANDYTHKMYLREDTAAQSILWNGLWGNTWEGGGMSFAPIDTVNVQPFWRWPKGNVVKADSISIDGVKHPRWNFKAGNQEFFYQATGIGGVGGLLGFPKMHWNSGNGGIPRSLDYIYKNDSLHFDFPLY